MANNLYRELIVDNLNKGKRGFWGDYAALNNVAIPSPAMNATVQKMFIEEYERASLAKSGGYKEIEAFLNTAKQELTSHENIVGKRVEEQVYARIMNLMNSAFIGSSLHPKNMLSGTQGLSKHYKDEIYSELATLLASINVSQPVSKQILSKLKQIMKNKIPKEEYVQFKAKTAEELMVHKLNQNPSWRTVVTGGWLDDNGLQLIEDALTFNLDTISKPFGGGGISYTIKTGNGKTSKTASSIQDFFNQIDKISGAYTIQLSDPMYDALRNAAILKSQAKSSINPSLLNDSVRNSISLEQLGWEPMLLLDLYNLPDSYKYFKQNHSSQDLAALANYRLSQGVQHTMLARNDIYYTVDGFSTASEWMSKNNRILKFYPEVTSLDSTFLSKQRTYQLRTV